MKSKIAQKNNKQTENLKDLVIDAVQDKKAENVVSLNLSKVNDAVTDYFIICDATTTTQVKAIAESVLMKVKTEGGEHPWHKEGLENLDWVLIDYVDVVVHIFRTEVREFYQLEELWADAERKEYD